MKTLISALFAVLLTQSVIAGDRTAEQAGAIDCPMQLPEYDKIISTLSGFKSSLLNQQKCTGLAERISSLGDIMGSEGRQNFKNIITGLKGTELSVDQVKEVESYSKLVSGTAVEIIDMIKGPDNCVPEENKPRLLSTVASATQEITGLLSGVSGPYGIAINMGGTVFASILQGIDQYFANRKGYNFDDAEHRKLFVKNFCAYNEILVAVEDLSRPEDRLDALADLDKYLHVKLETLTNTKQDCRECTEYLKYYQLNSSFELPLQNALGKVKTQTHSGSQNAVELNWNRCVTLGKMVHDENSELSQIILRLKTYPLIADKTNNQKQLDELLSLRAMAEKVVLKPDSCWELGETPEEIKKLEFTNFRSTQLITSIIGNANDFLKGQLEYFKKAADSRFKNPLGTYIESSLAKQLWMQQEMKRIQALLRSGSNGSRGEILVLRDYLDSRIFGRLTPDFLKWKYEYYKDEFKAFNKIQEKWEKKALKAMGEQLQKINVKPATDLAKFFPQVQKNFSKADINVSVVYAEMRNNMSHFYRAHLAVQEINDYCAFLPVTGSNLQAIDQVCSSDYFKEAVAAINQTFASTIKAMEDFALWCEEVQGINPGAIRSKANHINLWLSRRDIFESAPLVPAAN